MLHYLYRITRQDAKEYIGVSINPTDRLSDHKYGRGSIHLKGHKTLTMEILACGTKEYIYQLEKAYILKFSPELNISMGGIGGAGKNTARGSKSGQSKLTEEQVEQIRIRHYNNGESKNSLAIIYGVTPTAISSICFGQTWKHAKGPIVKPIKEDKSQLIKRAKELRKLGYIYSDIAEILYVSPTTAFNYCKKYND